MSKIEIVYDGAYPNLCSGNLTVVIDGKEWDFGDYVLHSCGDVWFDDDLNAHVEEGPWEVDEDRWPKGFPEDLKSKVIDEINCSVEWGCCGGCI